MRTAGRRNKEPEPDLGREIDELKAQLVEAQETLRAIRAGEVDAVIASTPEGDRVFTLRGAETPYRVIVENISEGAATLLPDGVILYANEAFSYILNVPLERIIGTRFEDYVWEPDRIVLPALLENALEQTVRREIGLTHDVSLLPVAISLRRLPLDEGRTGLSMVVTDISERKRAEEDLRKAHDELEARVQRRTRELKEMNASLQVEIAERLRAEAEMKKAVDDLARSNSELQQFAYVASHDLQEPLRTVASYLELLQMRYRGKLDEKADKYISFAVDGASRMSTLINDLLAYSRVGSKTKAFSPTDVTAALRKVQESLASTIRQNNAVVTHDVLPVVMGDETQITLLLQNMLANAIKFRKMEVAPEIHVSARRDGNEWVFCIRDNGIGIDPAFQERVFAIFQRLHTREEYPGTGMGLAICRRIVELHGGRIWVESTPGLGSSFCFTLPARDLTTADEPG